MKTVIITADQPEHRYVTRCLTEALGSAVSGIVIEHGANTETSVVSTLSNAYRRYGALTVAERVLTKLIRKVFKAQRRHFEACQKILGSTPKGASIPAEMPVLEVISANQSECINWIENINPEYIFVYGTGLIRQKLLSLPSMGVLNLHTGISPYYRGSDCAFWPLHNNEPHLLGSTVHMCTPELDGGEIFDRVQVRLSTDDDPYTAFAKAAKAGASLYAAIAKQLVDGEEVPTEKQDFSLGKEYRFKDKTFVQEILMECRVRSGKIGRMIADSEEKSLPFKCAN